MTALVESSTFLQIYTAPDIELALLSALMSSITRFPFSTVVHEIHNIEPEKFVSLRRLSVLETLLQLADGSGRTLQHVIASNFPNVSFESLKLLLGGADDREWGASLKVTGFLLNSSIGCRVLDYIQRDAAHIGMSHGNHVEIEELFRHLTWNGFEIALRTSGLSIVEEVISMRYWMFSRVYWNTPNRALISMMKRVLVELSLIDATFEQFFLNLALAENWRGCLRELSKYAVDKKCDVAAELLALLSLPRPFTYKEVVQFSRGEGSVGAASICDKFSQMRIDQWRAYEFDLQTFLVKRLKLDPSSRPAVIVDYVREDGAMKLGEDISVVTSRGLLDQLRHVSGIVEGAQSGFREHLLKVRVFVDPEVVANQDWNRLRDLVSDFVGCS